MEEATNTVNKPFDLAPSATTIAEVAQRYGTELLIYGSVATAIDRADSDLNILAIGLARGRDTNLATDLCRAIGREVTVTRKEDLTGLLAARIIGEARTVAQLLAGERPTPSMKFSLMYLFGTKAPKNKFLAQGGVRAFPEKQKE
jgi:predicted nucleotidyltransferase